MLEVTVKIQSKYVGITVLTAHVGNAKSFSRNQLHCIATPIQNIFPCFNNNYNQPPLSQTRKDKHHPQKRITFNNETIPPSLALKTTVRPWSLRRLRRPRHRLSTSAEWCGKKWRGGDVVWRGASSVPLARPPTTWPAAGYEVDEQCGQARRVKQLE